MPLLFKRSGDHFEWAVWHITEQESYFESHLTAPENIPNPKVRLQWYATRHLINELTGAPCVIWKDEYGRPYLQNRTEHISFSHTVNYAAAIVSKNSETGIDIEAVHPRVERIAHKFLRADELEAIAPEERTAKLMLLWSAKEALYKMYGRKQLDFTTQLLITPFTMQTAGQLHATVVAEEQPQPATVCYRFFEGQVVAWAMAD